MNGGTVGIMEIIMISSSKLKVMLGADDLRQFELNADQLDYSNTDTKRMFWDVLSKAKHQTGFDTDGQRVLVQLYPSKEGGCEMFVTKIGILCSSDSFECRENKGDDKCHEIIYKNKKNSSFSVFSFESTEDMISVCRRLRLIGYIGESSAYFDEKGKAYLFLSDIEFDELTPPDEFSFILEYAKPENLQKLNYYFSEHGKLICEKDAVSILSTL